MEQLTLHFDSALDAHRDARECFAACVYRQGLKRCAAELDVQPSHLSEMLSGGRNLDIGLIERYVDAFRDPTPILYLASRHLRDNATRQAAALQQLAVTLQPLLPLLQASGLMQSNHHAAPAKRRGRA